MNLKVAAVAKKEILHIIRDPRSLIMAIAMPMVLLFLFGYAITLDINNVTMSVCDNDKSAKSREFIQGFKASGYFKIVKFTDRENDINDFLDRGDSKVGIIIPGNFSKSIYKNEPVNIQVLVDGTESNSSNIIIGYIKGITYLYSSGAILNVLNANGISRTDDIAGIEGLLKVFYNQDLKSRNFIVPGLIAVIMTVIMTILTSLTVVREKEKGTFEQLIVTPLKSYEFMLGKMFPYWMLGMFDMLLVVLAGTLVFGVPLKGSIILLFGITGIFAFCGLGLGLLVSTLAETQQVANQIGMLISFLPVFILSGFMFPIKSMPKIIQFFTAFIPAKYFLIILRGIFLKGSGLSLLLYETFILFVFGAVLVGLASLNLRKKL